MPVWLTWTAVRGLLTSKVFQYGILILGIFLALEGLYWKGHNDGYQVCDSAHKAAAAAEEKRQVKVGEQVNANSAKETAEDRKQDDANAGHVAAAVEKIRATPRPRPKPKFVTPGAVGAAVAETVTITGKKADEPNNEVSFADAVCIPSSVADELRALR